MYRLYWSEVYRSANTDGCVSFACMDVRGCLCTHSDEFSDSALHVINSVEVGAVCSSADVVLMSADEVRDVSVRSCCVSVGESAEWYGTEGSV